ncbi:MAG: flagellar basal body rod protein FlgB [Campylobacterota bacterium]|nr:flagellar basal body rod protein FlgB [Campylobacterota bacterium]
MKPSNVTDLLYDRLSVRSDQQKIISGNIANINTPNYKTQKLVFDDELSKVQNKNDLALRVTHSNHIAFEEVKSNKSSSRIVEVKGLEEQNDGNNVNLDKQMSEMSKNQIAFNAIQASVKKDAAWLKEIIASSGKN